MNAQQLKNSILQMAVQGKLVPQDPHDEPAKILLERIRKEKEQLIKEKKIKKEKNPSYIFRGADNLPYEKIGKNEPVCIADEVPFEIPDSWEWVRFSTVIELQSGQDLTPDKYNDKEIGIPYITGASNISNGHITINRWTEFGRAFAYQNDLLLTCKGTIGTMARLRFAKAHIARQIMALRPIRDIEPAYIEIVLDTLVTSLKSAAKSMIPGISRNDILNAFLPLPPLSEQKRIVTKINELIPYVKSYATTATELNKIDNNFSASLKRSILQWAIQGKLVSQNVSDEPAKSLIARIQVEKDRLTMTGKLKKDKHESIIFKRDNSYYEKLDGVERCIDDEIPFSIPNTWQWARLGTILINKDSERVPLSVTERSNLKKIYDYYGASGIIDKVENYLFSKPLLLIGEDGANLLLRSKPIAFIAKGKYWVNNHAHVLDAPSGINLSYVALYINAINLAPYVTGTAQPKMNQAKMNSILIPIPPLEEQLRIVKKVEYINSIIQSI